MRKNIMIGLGMTLGLSFGLIGFSCAKSSTDTATAASRKLYIATGLCYSGVGFSAPTVNDVGQTLARLDLDSRQYEVVHDYANLANEVSGTFAAGIANGNDGYIYVAVENANSAGNRRIDRVAMAAYGAKSVWQTNNNVLLNGGALKGIGRTPVNGIIFGTSTAVERFDAGPARVTSGALGSGSPWGTAFANNGANKDCSANNTNITSLVVLPSAVSGDQIGKFIYSHAAAGQMDIGVISKDGVNATTPCLFNTSGGAAGALTNSASAISTYAATLSASATPTAMAYIPSSTAGTGKLLVAYSSASINTAVSISNALVMYDFTENTTAGETATLGNGQILWNDVNSFSGVSAMAFDSADNSLYVSRVDPNGVAGVGGAPHGYILEKFTIDTSTPKATRVLNSNNSAFEESNSFNNCVTSMFIGS